MLAAVTILLGGRPLLAVEVTVSSDVLGKTPALVGYNSGHFYPDSNTADWWKYSGVNAARVWSSPATVEGTDDNSVWGDGVGSLSQFLTRRADLRNDPLNTQFINWPRFESRYQNNTTDGNLIRLKYAFENLHALGIAPIAVIQRTNTASPFRDSGTAGGWQDRWEHWQHFYAQAFYLAQHYDVERFHMYNEPDHSSQSISQADYLERLQFASDAVQAAVADVNALFGKSLTAQVQAPVTAGASNRFTATPGGDPRDDLTGWGELITQNLHTTFQGVVDPDFQLFHTYAYQQYNASGAGFGNELSNIKNLVHNAAGDADIRVAITEFNVHTAAVLDDMTDTLDTPSKFARLGSILSNLANNQPDELYLFKFSQTANFDGGEVKKNGVHYVDSQDAPYDVGGITKGGEVFRLFAKAFAGGRDLLAVPNATGAGASDLHIAVSHQADADQHYVFSSNVGTSSRELQLNLGAWGVAAGSRVFVEEVSADRQGEIRSILEVPPTGTITLTQPGESVLLVSVPHGPPGQVVTLDATDDAMVKAGANAGVNYGTSANLLAKNDPTNPNARNATFIQFDLGDVDVSDVNQAVLRVHGENLGSAAQVIAHVYGIVDDDWDESTIIWANAPNLAASVSNVSDIADNFIEEIGETATFVGHLTGRKPASDMMLDVTDFLREHPDQKVSFLVAREVRFEGENVDDDLTNLQLASKERLTNAGPQLLLFLATAPIPGDFDSSGAVDAADYDLWCATYGSHIDLRADGNGDGIVDGADYTVWRDNLVVGAGTAQVQNTGSIAVPEPNSAFLVMWVSAIWTPWYRAFFR